MLGRWFRFIRFSHTLFALPFGVLAMVYAFTRPGVAFRWRFLLGVLLCLVFARSAAMAYNRIRDRAIDATTVRGRDRELPRGLITPRQAWIFTFVCLASFWASTLLLNPLAFVLAPVAIAMFLGYTHAKRFTPLCHFWLGATLGLAPLGAFIAITGTVTLPVALLSLGVMCWVAGFDIPYSMVDVEDDRRNGLRSIPRSLGLRGAVWVARLSSGAACVLFALSLGMMGGQQLLLALSMGLMSGTEVFLQLSYSSRNLKALGPGYMLAEGINSLVFATVAGTALLLGA